VIGLSNDLSLVNTTGKLVFGADTYLGRGGAATLQQGGADSATPINQTFQAQGVAVGTSDTAGASFTLRPGVGRGNAVPAPLILNRSSASTVSGTAAQAQVGMFVLCGTKMLSTTSATAQTIVTASTFSPESGGLTIFYNVSANSATAANADTGTIHVSWNNASGTVAATMSTIVNPVQSNSSGTLASTPTVTVATNVVSVKLTPTWTTIVPVKVRATFSVMNFSENEVVCQ